MSALLAMLLLAWVAKADELTAATIFAMVRGGEAVSQEQLEDGVRRGIDDPLTRREALQMAGRLPCARSMPLMDGLQGGELPRAAESCASEAVEWWLMVARWQVAGRYLDSRLPPPPEVNEAVRIEAARLLIGSHGTERWEQHGRTAARILRLDQPQGSLVLPAGATPYAQLLSVPRGWGCDGSGGREVVDDIMLLEWTGVVPTDGVLLLTPEEARASLVLCGTRVASVWHGD